MKRGLREICAKHAAPDALVDELQAWFDAALERASATTTAGQEPPWAPSEDEPELTGVPYEDLGLLGVGGMGEVRRVRDASLDRPIALKVMRRGTGTTPHLVHQFLREAQLTAQLQHPGIPPVHTVGQLSDGRVWYTMREIRGRTLDELVQSQPPAWTVEARIRVFLQVCDAISHAHGQGLMHRDLSPRNVMVGDHGAVTVVDWGLAARIGEHDALSQSGSAYGTPAYLSPERAAGLVRPPDPADDVYALGAILYLLLAGKQAVAGKKEHVLELLRTGISPPTPPGPEALVSLCVLAMRPTERLESAEALAHGVRAWLDGTLREQEARALVAESEVHQREAERLYERARVLQREAKEALEDNLGWMPETTRHGGWALEDRAAATRLEASLTELCAENRLHAALQLAPTLPEGSRLSVARHKKAHAAAEQRRDASEMARLERRIEDHVRHLPETDSARLGVTAYLTGAGALTLVTEPAGARVRLLRYELRTRRLVAVPTDVVATTPVLALSIPMGSYLCLVEHPDCDPIRVPVAVGRLEHWDQIPPGGSEPTPIRLPPRGSIGRDQCLVPPGWFLEGGDPETFTPRPLRRLWCDGFVMDRYPVTNAQFITFLDALVAAGRTDEALRQVPRELAGTAADDGEMIYGFDGQRFCLRPDADGDVWDPQWPVLQVGWHGARAYLAWRGAPWRLPAALEWQKAARGVDGRFFPWGDHHDPSWCNMINSRQRALPCPIEECPLDESVYGIRGLGGNVLDWTATAPDDPQVDGERVIRPSPGDDSDHPRRVFLGGFWDGSARGGRAAGLNTSRSIRRRSHLGFRGVYDW